MLFKIDVWLLFFCMDDVGESNGTPLQYFCLENPMNGGAWKAAVYGVTRVWHDWATSLSLFTFMHWRRKCQPTPVFLPGESQGWGAWWAAVYGVAQSRTQLKWLSSSMDDVSIDVSVILKRDFPGSPVAKTPSSQVLLPVSPFRSALIFAFFILVLLYWVHIYL